MATYRTRLETLEAKHAPASGVPQHFVVEFVNAQREVVTLLADGQWFHRADGESEGESRQRRAERLLFGALMSAVAMAAVDPLLPVGL